MAKCNKDCFNCPYEDCIEGVNSGYRKEYYEANKDKILAYVKKYRDSHKEQRKEYFEKFCVENYGSVAEYNKMMYEKRKAYHKKYYKENKERYAEKNKAYYQKNKESVLAYSRKQYANKKKGVLNGNSLDNVNSD